MPAGLTLNIDSNSNSNNKSRTSSIITMVTSPRLDYSVTRIDGALVKKEGAPSTFTFGAAASADTFHRFIESGKYRSEPKAGEGSYGSVYKFKRGGQEYILKAYTKGINRADIENEINALMALDGSPYIVRLLAADVYSTSAFLLFPYVKGQTLDKWLATVLSHEERSRVFHELMLGYNYIHSKGFVHRDIKPENIWVPSDQEVPPFYLDFGLAIPIGTRTSDDRGAIKASKENTGQTGEIPHTTAINVHAYNKMFADSYEKIREYPRIKVPPKPVTHTPLPSGIGNADAGIKRGGTRKRRRVSRRMKKAHKTLRNRRSHLSSIRLKKRRNTRF